MFSSCLFYSSVFLYVFIVYLYYYFCAASFGVIKNDYLFIRYSAIGQVAYLSTPFIQFCLLPRAILFSCESIIHCVSFFVNRSNNISRQAFFLPAITTADLLLRAECERLTLAAKITRRHSAEQEAASSI